jgi:hypothetical protein
MTITIKSLATETTTTKGAPVLAFDSISRELTARAEALVELDALRSVWSARRLERLAK